MRRRYGRGAAKQSGPPYRLTGEDLDEQVFRSTLGPPGFHIDAANADVYQPRPHQLVPKAGAWAMITRQLPPLEADLDEKLRVGRVFYLTHFSNADDEGFSPDHTYKVKCDSPWGTVTLWPYEYTVIEPTRLVGHWQAGALAFHPTNVAPAQFNAIVFYARSRCIGLADAMVMALGTIQAAVGWFEPSSPELAADLEAMAERIHAPLTAAFHQERRAAARKRMQA